MMTDRRHQAERTTQLAARTASTVAKSERVSTALWLVFLVIPALIAFYLPRTAAERAATLVGIVLFALVYLAAFERPRLIPRWPLPVNLALWLVVLCLPVALTLPALRWNVMSFLPFVVAIPAFLLPLRPGMITGGAITAAALTFAYVATSASGSALQNLGLYLGTSVGAVFVLLMRLVGGWDESASAARTEIALLREREAVARDVHDILGHSLTVIAVKTELAQRLITTDPARAGSELQEVLGLTRTSLAEVRSAVTQLKSPDFSVQLAASVRALEAAGVAVTIDGEPDVQPDGTLYAWALRELTTNVVRHAQATTVGITWTSTSLTVADDGIGLHADLAATGNGMEGLRARAGAIGADVRIRETTPGVDRPGMTVEVLLR